MADYEKTNELFVNPYNFVYTDLKKTTRSDITEKQKESLTGHLTCRMICRTPLAIPDVSRKIEVDKKEVKDEKVHYYYPFFTTDGVHPVIPGSSIRGVVRNVYETLTDSCFGTMQKDTKITARSSKAFKPGILIKREGTWELYQAKRRLVVIDERFYDSQHLAGTRVQLYNRDELGRYRTGDSVRFNMIRENGENRSYSNRRGFPIGDYVNINSEGEKSGYMCIGQDIERRHFQSIFEKGDRVRRITQDDFAGLEAVLQTYRNESINKHYKQKQHDGYKDYEYAKKLGIIPVYYTENGRLLYMSFAALGRKAFKTTLNAKAGEKAHEKCDSRTNLCPACALFGTIEGEKAGSRIRFTDAECSNYRPELLKKEITFAELGTPRMSYLPFYLREKGARADYSEGYDSNALEIRGRKFYWHHMPVQTESVVKQERNATFDVLDKEAEFIFKIYFHGISERQLELLAAAVHLNENDEEGVQCHKIGHGKPLGYGSVKIVIDECCVRELEESSDGFKSWKVREREVPCSEQCCECDEKTYNSLMTITNFHALDSLVENGADISYPEVILDERYENMRQSLGENELASHQWFTQNYSLRSRTPEDVLPEIMDEALTLQKRMLTNLQQNNQNRRQQPSRGNQGRRVQGNTGRTQGGNDAADQTIYEVEVLSESRPARNENYLEYDIKVFNAAEFSRGTYIMTAPKRIRLNVGDRVEATHFRGRLFNKKRN